mmetsp:Transcript_9272/g.20037  ORF Transcript_9272/g.20037 Transcript_9272/m.20037 type:complete len:311 (+) Transcript_9272:409-1341(+)|eukprot:CAMPEP_0168747820 /NCGR_PEP_ID=MMETSP0724-20121128/15854_1 /TAXON_ID=265536 /ORGANISM="Amphiprora sp., Strain CCMP467" /LENGTH=310 /DNA_ID=CAMNT_0008795623 /DNA_START=292 /DNA_END=1224 /DNA_ORIENTATION=-
MSSRHQDVLFTYREGMDIFDLPRQNNITHVMVPLGVTTISPYLFCTSRQVSSHLRQVKISTSVESIGSGAFGECFQLAEVIFVASGGPSLLRHVDASVFFRCTALKRMDFSQCPNLIHLAHNNFDLCASLEIVLLPPNLQSIGDRCFAGCKALANIDFPKTLQRIDTEAFDYCTKLETIQIPASMQHLGNGAFRGCRALKIVLLESFATLAAAGGGGDGAIRLSTNAHCCDCTSLHAIQWPHNNENYPIALWPRIISWILSNLLGPTQEKNKISCLFSSLVDHREELLSHATREQSSLKRTRQEQAVQED